MPDLESLKLTLADLPARGTLIKDRGYRQVWRVEQDNAAYYVKFYPRLGNPLKRLVRGSPAMREFLRLQKLQKAHIPAPIPVSVLMGFHLSGQIGDAVVIQAIEPATPLDQLLNELKLNGDPIPNHLELARQIRQLCSALARAGLGHADLHLGNILLHDRRLYLLDGYAVRTSGLRLSDLQLLAHSVNRYATRTDLLRGWDQLGTTGFPPKINRVGERQIRKFLERSTENNAWFGKLDVNGWRGHFFKSAKFKRRWAPASGLTATAADWQRAFPLLLERKRGGHGEILKQSRSGEVWADEIVLGGRPVSVIVKRPLRRYWYRYINEIGRGSRAMRAWRKAWNLVGRNIATAWPLAVLEKRKFGYVTDCVIVFERVAGPTLSDVDLESLSPDGRDKIFRRTGRVLRQIERMGFSHFDAKASNWIVQHDEKLGPRPILIDVDGIRHRKWTALGIRRLLRAMEDHPQYTPADSLALCEGYAPYSPAKISQEKQYQPQMNTDEHT